MKESRNDAIKVNIFEVIQTFLFSLLFIIIATISVRDEDDLDGGALMEVHNEYDRKNKWIAKVKAKQRTTEEENQNLKNDLETAREEAKRQATELTTERDNLQQEVARLKVAFDAETRAKHDAIDDFTEHIVKMYSKGHDECKYTF